MTPSLRPDGKPFPAKSRHSPAGVLFDLDGTLLNTLEDLTDAMNTALRQGGYPTRSMEEVRYLVGKGVDAFARGALPRNARHPAGIANLITAYRAEYAKAWARKTRPYPGIVDLLRGLDRRGILMAVLSNKPDAAVKEAVAHFFPRIPFVEVWGSRPEVPMKPEATAALRLAECLGTAPEHMLFVGDTKTDMRTARSAGMVPVGVLWGFRTAEELSRHGAKYRVRRPADILALPEWKAWDAERTPTPTTLSTE